jgi:hypothetical protein
MDAERRDLHVALIARRERPMPKMRRDSETVGGGGLMAGAGEEEYRTPLRVRYLHGQLLTAEDLEDEQRYHVEMHRLHNRWLHGWGVVSGLEVKAAEGWTVQVEPGYALDAYGREIVVPEPQRVDVAQPTNDKGEPEGPRVSSGQVSLGLLYREMGVEPRPIPGEEEPLPSRIAESFRLVIRTDPSRYGSEGVILATIRVQRKSIEVLKAGRRLPVADRPG